MTIEQWGANAWTSMNNAFFGCSNLTSTATDVPNLSAVTDMSDMFNGASSFNGAISSWNTAAVTNMSYMFVNAISFNQDISSWNTAAVTNMSTMFSGATAFNQNISGWNTATVTDMSNMFNGASSFNQDLGGWDISNVYYMDNMFTNITLSTSNYDNTLIGWNTLSGAETAIPSNITFDGGNSKYCAGQAARAALIAAPNNWTITDGGRDASCTLAVSDFNLAKSLKLYPNPATDRIYFKGDISKIQELTIYSVQGKIVKELHKNFKEINIKSLSRGLYFVKIRSKMGQETVKIIKK